MSVVPELKSHDELALFNQARRGSSEAFGELVRRYHLDVRVFLSRFVGDPGTVDDLAQEVFLAAVRQIEEVQGASFRNWLLAVARYKAMDHLRKKYQGRELVHSQIERAVIEQHLQQLDHDPSNWPESGDDLLLDLEHCLAMLKPRQREIVQKFYFESQTAEKISQVMEQKAGSIRMALVRIRDGLRQCLNFRKQSRANHERP